MSISFRFWILFGVIVTSCFISVYCTAAVELLVELDSEKPGLEHGNGTTPVAPISKSVVTDEEEEKVTRGGRDRGIFARCFGTLWDWVYGTASTQVSSLMEDKIISGNPDNVKFYLYPSAE